MQLYYDTSITQTRSHSLLWTCGCTTTCCGHYPVVVEITAAAYVPPEPPPRPRPWIRHAAVVPSFRNPALPPWRPRQQRARDGI